MELPLEDSLFQVQFHLIKNQSFLTLHLHFHFMGSFYHPMSKVIHPLLSLSPWAIMGTLILEGSRRLCGLGSTTVVGKPLVFLSFFHLHFCLLAPNTNIPLPLTLKKSNEEQYSSTSTRFIHR